MTVPNQFANVTTSIPLSQLDANFNTPITLGNTAIQLGNTVSTLNNMTLANVTVTSGNVTITNVTVTTANVTTANIGTSIITTSETLNYGTANQVQYLNASKVLTGSANLTFDGTTLTPHTLTVSTGVLTVPAGSNTAPSITTSGDTNTGIYFPAADTVAIGTGGTERLRVDSAGNLGLGVTPSAWSSGRPAIEASGFSLQSYSANYLALGQNEYVNSSLQYIYKTSAAASLYTQISGAHAWYTAASGTAGNAITFTQAMTLDASGNLGIGTSSPSHLLQATKNQNATTRIAVTNSDTTNTSSRAAFQATSGTVNCDLTAIQSLGGFLGTSSNHDLNFVTNGSTRATITSGGDFYVGDTNNTLGNTRLYIKGDGTNPASRIWANTSTTSVYGLVVRHESTTAGAYIQFVTDTNVETGRIYDLAGTMQYASSSDARLKTNVQPMQNSLQSVLALNPCTFDMRRGEDAFIPSAGLIAQEVHEVYPFVVGVGGDDENTNPWSVDYGKLTPLLVAAIKELNAKVEVQAAEIAALKGNA